ncbi:MAG TPA: SUMF1/EgtB/PvdO family nonheme iron enzyme, partial [Saprospiraceae bacterium]|nr:SUMF1/EgtB/PvdO family nonheme iron enzyme [Saprospiraceae bacterium]
MKRLLKSLIALIVLSAIISSCGSRQNGQLLGVLERPTWKGINPYGMVYVPSGTLHIGVGDEDVSGTFVQRPKSISIQGFYMDDTEITNNEYRQFVYWVRDSLAHSMLDHYIEDETTGDQKIDWEYEIDWEDETLQELYYQGADKFAGKQEYNTDKFVYEYEWYDWKGA